MSIFRISPQAFSRRSGTRVLKSGRVPAQSHARTFSESVRIMSADHAPARTLAEGGNASLASLVFLRKRSPAEAERAS